MLTWGLGVLVNDLSIGHTLSKHNSDALLNGSQHTYAWRVCGCGTKTYWYHTTAYSMKQYFACLDFPNLFMGAKVTHTR